MMVMPRIYYFTLLLPLLLSVLLFSCLLPAKAATLHVNSITGNDTECTPTITGNDTECSPTITGNDTECSTTVTGINTECSPNISMVSSIPCFTIEHAYNLLQGQSNVTIYIETDIDLQQVLVFRNVSNISISGILPSDSHNPITHKVKCWGMAAGFQVEAVSSFSMSYLELTYCSVQEDEQSYRSALIFNMSSDISLFTTTLVNSSSSGIVFLDCYGNTDMRKVYINESGQNESSKATGLTIENTKLNQPGKYTLKECIFHRNSNNCYHHKNKFCYDNIHWGNSEFGGGMSISIIGNCSGFRVSLDECNFSQNVANWGGGLYVHFGDETQNNTVIATNCYFSKNRARNAGGGANIGFNNSRELVNRTNVVYFQHTVFIDNIAKYGGGVAIASTFADVPYSPWSNIIFKNCSWKRNTAVISPAVDISPFNTPKYIERNGFLPMPVFHDVTIIDNRIQNNNLRFKKTLHVNSGVFLVTQFKVHFSGHVCFKNNVFSAMQAVSSGIIFEPKTTVTFLNNRGTNGAAVALYGLSYISVSENTSISFKNNSASDYGGGIYYSGIDQHDFVTGSSCFLEYNGPATIPVKDRNITFTFEGNFAKSGGHWIYADSFLSCMYHCQSGHNGTVSIHSIFKCIGDFKPNESIYPNNTIMSSGRKFVFGDRKKIYSAIPGSKVNIPFYVADDLNQPLHSLLSITVSRESPIKINRQYMLTGDIFPIGPPNHSVKVEVTVQGIRKIFFEFKLATLPCPPGFIYDNTTHVQSCVCGTDRSIGKYSAILSCNMTSFRASMDKQYWAGYIPSNTTNPENLYFAPCYAPICSRDILHLPNTSSELDQNICGKDRKGIMCGHCQHNYTVYYHSRSLSCKFRKHCHLGPLFYIVSEILSVMALFVVVVTFDLNFTSGNAVGFIFFCHYLDGFTLYDNHVFSLLKSPYRLFYGVFNFEYFTIEQLSFCLWEHFDIQDIIAFKYLTIVFALALVLMLITLLKNDRCKTLCSLRTRVSDKRSFIRGLSAFLVICYIQCTKTSFLLLKYVHPMGLNGRHTTYFSYYGGQPYFKGKHLLYGFMAIISLLVVTVLPPLVLLLHPLMLRLLSLCGLSEHWLVLKVFCILRIHKLVPFIDCFQSCYKDRCRFFAGLYFLYRVSLLLCSITAESFSSLLVYLQMLLLLFLGIHSMVQPYKERLHNIIDCLIFGNLALINVITLIGNDDIMNTNGFLSMLLPILQLILLYLPMIACLLWVSRKLYHYYKNRNWNVEYEELHDDIIEDRDEDSTYHTQMQVASSLPVEGRNSSS